MKISIDLDDTILVKPDFPYLELGTSPLIRGCIEEYFRESTKELFEYLNNSDFEVGIYSNSYRGKTDLENCFKENGFHINFVINQQIHDARIDKEPNRYSLPDKCPHLFGIDLHIDDLIEIKENCESYNTKVILAEANKDWYKTVITEIKNYVT